MLNARPHSEGLIGVRFKALPLFFGMVMEEGRALQEAPLVGV
jgi:hypothetical protein